MTAKSWMTLAVATAALLGTSTASAAPRRARIERGPTLTVVSSGSEQALKYGDTLLSRPFGAQLVDGISVVGRYGDAHEWLFIVEGTAGAACPARYVVVVARRDQTPLVSAPFGTCGMGVTARPSAAGLAITVAPGPNDAAPVGYVYAQGSVRPLAAPARIADAASGAPVLRCRNPSDVAAQGAGAFEDELDRALPDDWRTASGVRRAEIEPARIDATVAGLACLAAVPGNGDPVARAAAPLFASRRYGGQAFSSLDRIARASSSDPGLRASARLFAANMSYFVARREPL